MKNEMDLTRMDERQRNAWLLANRATLMIVGLTWLGMIGWELTQQRQPIFLMAMVPVFALVRYGLFRYYTRTR
jgi:hypothetical protein